MRQAFKLDNNKIKEVFGWRPVWNINQAVEKTVEWTKAYINKENVKECTDNQINQYLKQVEDSVRIKFDCSEPVINGPIWARFVNYFVDRKWFMNISILIKPIQIILSNKNIFKFLFVNLMKHEVYNGKL